MQNPSRVFRNLFSALPSSLIVAAIVLFAYAAPAPAQDVALRVGDQVDIRIGGVPPGEQAVINNSYTIDGNGNINLHLIGLIRAAGRTPAQLANSIQESYKANQYYTNPSIQINQQSAPRFVNVAGEVKAPQRVAYTPDLTLMGAITAAGGFSDYADRKKVRLSRGGKAMVVNAALIIQQPSEDIQLEPGDQITIPATWF